MLNLGFLKKKRTRGASSDSTSASQPTSPVTPTGTKSSERAFKPSYPTTKVAPAASTTVPAAPASQAQPSASHQQAAHTDSTPISTSTKAAAPGPSSVLAPSANMDVAQQYQTHKTVPANPPASTPSPGTDIQNLPSISSLINPSHIDQQQHHNQQAPANPTAYLEKPTAIDDSQIQIQSQLLLQQQQQYQVAQQAALQPHPGLQFNAHHQVDLPRTTKGKYSLVDFNILRTLGTGSFGRVHLVQSRHNQRFYAVKVLKKAQVVRMKQVEHTNDERRMLAEVKHPFLITLWGTFQDAKSLYMVMDFVEGGELFSLLRKSAVS